MKERVRRPRIIQLAHACGHEAPIVTRTGPKGEAKLRRQAATKGCGQCFWEDGPASSYEGPYPMELVHNTDTGEMYTRPMMGRLR